MDPRQPPPLHNIGSDESPNPQLSLYERNPSLLTGQRFGVNAYRHDRLFLPTLQSAYPGSITLPRSHMPVGRNQPKKREVEFIEPTPLHRVWRGSIPVVGPTAPLEVSWPGLLGYEWDVQASSDNVCVCLSSSLSLLLLSYYHDGGDGDEYTNLLCLLLPTVSIYILLILTTPPSFSLLQVHRPPGAVPLSSTWVDIHSTLSGNVKRRRLSHHPVHEYSQHVTDHHYSHHHKGLNTHRRLSALKGRLRQYRAHPHDVCAP